MSTTVQAAPPRDYAQETRDTLATQLALAPQQYASEAQYQPLYNRLQLQLANEALTGYEGTPGLLQTFEQQLYPAMSRMSAAANTAQRQADIADVEALGGRASAAFLNANPELKAQLDRATALGQVGAPAGQTALEQQLLGAGGLGSSLQARAMQALQAGGQLSPEEQRQAAQAARSAYAARGMGLGEQAVAGEVQNRLINQRQRELENLQLATTLGGQYNQSLGQLAQLQGQTTAADRQYAAQLAALRQATASDPFQAILGRPSAAFNAAPGVGGMAQNIPGQAGPALFNPESSYANNIYGGNQQAITAANTASASARASMIGGIAGGLGSLAGGSLGASIFKKATGG